MTAKQLEQDYSDALAIAQECGDSGQYYEAMQWAREAESIRAEIWECQAQELEKQAYQFASPLMDGCGGDKYFALLRESDRIRNLARLESDHARADYVEGL